MDSFTMLLVASRSLIQNSRLPGFPKYISRVSTNRDLTCAYLYDPRFIEDRVPRRLIAFHVPQDATYADIVRVNQTKGSDIDKIVLEVLEVEGFDILWKSERANRVADRVDLCYAFQYP